MRGNEVYLKNGFGSDVNGVTVPEEAYTLLEEFSQLALSDRDWKEVYERLIRKLTELHDSWQVLSTIYRAVSLRSDYTVASHVIGKFIRNFDLLFERLPGKPAYYIPSATGRWLFENLVSPSERQEVKAEADERVSAVQQLSLMSFITHPSRGVRV